MRKLALVLLLIASQSMAASSHRSVFAPVWSYTPPAQAVDVTYSQTLDISTYTDRSVFTFNLQTGVDCDLFLEYSVYLDGICDGLLNSDLTTRGEPYAPMWCWNMARAFDGTYSDAYSIDASVYVTNDMESWLSMADVSYRCRFMLRYVDSGGNLVQTGWYRSPVATIASSADTEPPEIVSQGSPTAMNFSFGVARSLIMHGGFTVADVPVGKNFAYMTRATSVLTGEARYPDASSVEDDGARTRNNSTAGVVDSYIAAKLTRTLQDLVADGDHLWSIEVKLWDARCNSTDWMAYDTIDLRDFD